MIEKRRRNEPQASFSNGGSTSRLNQALKSIVTVQAVDSRGRLHGPDAGGATLGQRIVIRESGLVLTIGYLIMEAENVWLADAQGRVTPAHALAVDAETGFGRAGARRTNARR